MTELHRKVEHVFVLMLENRSFDHMLGFARLAGVHGANPALSRIGATDRLNGDLPHELGDVARQLQGAGHFQPVAFDCFHPDCLPVLGALAQEYAVCDQWYSSMPGPTWPNRFFVHAGSSGGLDNSPSSLASIASITFDSLGFKFEHGHLFDRLGEGAWRLYYGEAFPQALAIKGLHKPFLRQNENFRKLHRLRDDLHERPFAAKYVFIEPDYGILRLGNPNFKNGNSQHPIGSVAAGEQLIRDVYEWILESPVWEKSLLVICYDEHGGFYDHLPPPPAVMPGDAILNYDRAQAPGAFAFDRLGFRVPAVIVSPWIPRGTVSHALYDHTSVLRTLDALFGIGSFTYRDAAANAFAELLSLSRPRTDKPRPPVPVICGVPGPGGAQIPPYVTTAELLERQAFGKLEDIGFSDADGQREPDGLLNGFTRIAATVELAMDKKEPRFLKLAQAIAPLSAGAARDYIYKVALEWEAFKNRPEPAPLAR